MRQVLHVIGEYDYYFNCPRLEIMGRVMSDALFQLCNRSLRVDVVPAIDLTDYVISKVSNDGFLSWRSRVCLQLGRAGTRKGWESVER